MTNHKQIAILKKEIEHLKREVTRAANRAWDVGIPGSDLVWCHHCNADGDPAHFVHKYDCPVVKYTTRRQRKICGLHRERHPRRG